MAGASSKASTGEVGIDQIPTLTQLYADKVVPPPEHTWRDPSKDFNDRVSYWIGDITTLRIGAITNPANPELAAGDGICGTIFNKAGRVELQKACKAALQGRKDIGPIWRATITDAFKLPCKYIVHTVGPDCRDSTEQYHWPRLLEDAYRHTLEEAAKNDVKEIALCLIGTGIYQCPVAGATVEAVETVRKFLEGGEGKERLERIIFCIHPSDAADSEPRYKKLLGGFFPPAPEGPQTGSSKTGGKRPAPGPSGGEPSSEHQKTGTGSSKKPTQGRQTSYKDPKEKGTNDDPTDPPQPPPRTGLGLGGDKPGVIDPATLHRPDPEPKSTGGPSGKANDEPIDPVLRIRTWAGRSLRGDGGGELMNAEDREELHSLGVVSKVPRLSRPGRRG